MYFFKRNFTYLLMYIKKFVMQNRFSMDGLASGVVFKDFGDKTSRYHCHCMFLLLNSADSCEPISDAVVMHRTLWLPESSQAPELWCHNRDVKPSKHCVFLYFKDDLPYLRNKKIILKCNVNEIESIGIQRDMSNVSLQANQIKFIVILVQNKVQKLKHIHMLLCVSFTNLFDMPQNARTK